MPTFLTYPLAKEKVKKLFFLAHKLVRKGINTNGSNRHLRANNPHKNQIPWPLIKTHNKNLT